MRPTVASPAAIFLGQRGKSDSASPIPCVREWHGIDYEVCKQPKSDLFRDMLPWLNASHMFRDMLPWLNASHINFLVAREEFGSD